MNCPVCGGNTAVKGCADDVDSVIRRRVCVNCGEVFYTEEVDMDFEKGKKLLNRLHNKKYVLKGDKSE